METTSRDFRHLTRVALENETLQDSLDGVRKIMPALRQNAIDQQADFDGICDRATAIRDEAIHHLDRYLAEFERRVVRPGGACTPGGHRRRGLPDRE